MACRAVLFPLLASFMCAWVLFQSSCQGLGREVGLFFTSRLASLHSSTAWLTNTLLVTSKR